MSFALDQEALSLLSVKLEGNEVIVEWWGGGGSQEKDRPLGLQVRSLPGKTETGPGVCGR